MWRTEIWNLKCTIYLKLITTFKVVAKRLLHYVAAGLLSIEDLKTHIDALESQDPDNVFTNLLQTINDPFELVAELQSLYQESYKSYVHVLKEMRQQETEDDIGSSVAERMTTAFNALDEDMSTEALSVPSQEGTPIFRIIPS